MAENSTPKKLTFGFEKSPTHATYHVDGAWGGITGNGTLAIELYAEKINVPESVTYEISPPNEQVQPVEKKEREHRFVRELQCGIIMDMHATKRFRDWLSRKIDQFEKMSGEKL